MLRLDIDAGNSTVFSVRVRDKRGRNRFFTRHELQGETLDPIEEIFRGLNPKDIMVEEVRVGPFLTGVRLGGMRKSPGSSISRCGIASTVAHYEPASTHRFQGAGKLEKLSAGALLRFLISDVPLKASIGMAALNAILEVPDECFQGRSFMDLIMERCRGRRVAVVGHFPFVDRLRKAAKEFHVMELRPIRGDLPASKARDVIPKSQVVLITASVLINGTYRDLFPLCEETHTVMVGPSTPASSVLFGRGIDVLAGSMVVEPEKVMRGVSQGATYRDLEGVKKWVWERTS
jgi:uncharacterized protein (DUF4213/DUF364 family)